MEGQRKFQYLVSRDGPSAGFQTIRKDGVWSLWRLEQIPKHMDIGIDETERAVTSNVFGSAAICGRNFHNGTAHVLVMSGAMRKLIRSNHIQRGRPAQAATAGVGLSRASRILAPVTSTGIATTHGHKSGRRHTRHR